MGGRVGSAVRLSRPGSDPPIVLPGDIIGGGTRQGRHERTVVAMLVFAVYYNLSGLAQTWVEQGFLGAMPGVWWLHGLMLCAVVAFLLPEYRETMGRRA